MSASNEFPECTPGISTLFAGLQQLGAIAAVPTFHEDGTPSYEKARLLGNGQVSLMTATWTAGSESPLHGHGDSSALYLVVAGCLEEERWLPHGREFRYEKVILRPGDRSELPEGAYHQLRCITAAVTLHLYMPDLEDSAVEVSPAVEELLDKAKRRGTVVEPLLPRPNLLSTVNEHLEGWATREAQANADSAVRLPAETVAEIRASGLLAAPIPTGLGGWGASLAETAEAVRRVAQRAPSTALALAMPLGNAAAARIPAAAVPPEQRAALVEGQRWIAEQALQGKILAVANSEPGAGGDLANTKTIAVRDYDGTYRLSGRKSFATFGPDADYFLCAARKMDTVDSERPGVVDGFFVSRDALGLVLDETWNPAGMRPTASVGLQLEDAPAAAILGFPGSLEGVNARHWSTVLFTAVFLGIGEGALQEGTRFAMLDSSWARSQLADLTLELDAAAGLLESVARDERWPLPSDAQERTRRAKTFAARTSVEAATRIAMVCGGRSYSPQHPVFRFLCDALAGPLLRPPLPKAMDEIAKRFAPLAPAPTPAPAPVAKSRSISPPHFVFLPAPVGVHNSFPSQMFSYR